MFFSLSTKKLDNFPCHYTVNDKVLNLDLDWQTSKIDNATLFYKGYCDQKPLSEALYDFLVDPTPKYSGIFCIIIVRKNSIVITHSLMRVFSIFVYDDEIASLPNLKSFGHFQELENFYYLEINSSIEKKKIRNLITIDSNSLTLEQAVEKIDSLLTAKFINFYKYSKSKIKLVVNGGLDSITVASYLDKLNIPCEISFDNYQEFSPFMASNYDLIGDNYINFKVHVTKDSPNYVATGDWGDLAFGKDFCYAAFFKFLKSNPYDVVNANHYMYYFYHLEKNRNCFSQLSSDIQNYDLTKIRFKLLKDVIHSNNKASIFHLDQNYYFVPFADIGITKIIVDLDTKYLIENLLDSSVQKELINRNAPWMLDCVSQHKNINGRVNLFKFKDKFLEINKRYN